jgi:hypothetical protein
MLTPSPCATSRRSSRQHHRIPRPPLQGRRAPDGRLTIDAPGFAHNGGVHPAIEFPADLEAAIGREIGALLK